MTNSGLLLGITFLTFIHFFVSFVAFAYLSKYKKDNTKELYIALTWELSIPLYGIWKLLKLLFKKYRY